MKYRVHVRQPHAIVRPTNRLVPLVNLLVHLARMEKSALVKTVFVFQKIHPNNRLIPSNKKNQGNWDHHCGSKAIWIPCKANVNVSLVLAKRVIFHVINVRMERMVGVCNRSRESVTVPMAFVAVCHRLRGTMSLPSRRMETRSRTIQPVSIRTGLCILNGFYFKGFKISRRFWKHKRFY